MDRSTHFASPLSNSPPSWHHGGHFDPSPLNDSGYASEEYDFMPFLVIEPDNTYGDDDHAGRDSPRTRRRLPAAAFINAQWSHPATSRANHHFHDSLNDSWRTYDLLQPLPFEQERNNYASGSRLKPTTSYSHENFGREHGHTASRWDLEENSPPLNFEEHRARVPDTLPSLRDRIESETDHSSTSSSSSQQGSRSLEVKSNAPQSRGSTKSAQPSHSTQSSMRPSSRRQRQSQSSSRDAQLVAAWQQLYQERMKIEKERRALRKKEMSLLQRKDRPRSSCRDLSDDADGEGRSGSHGPDRTPKSDKSAW